LLILAMLAVLVVSEPAGAQTCYQFSNAHGDTPATVIATFPLTHTFIVTISRDGASRRLQFDGTNYPLTDPENTFSVFIGQTAGVSSNPFPQGLTATPPPFSVWGDHPSSSIDLGHVKLAAVSFVGPCTAPP